MVTGGRLTGHVFQKPGVRVHRLVHRGHPHQGLERICLGELALDRGGQV